MTDQLPNIRLMGLNGVSQVTTKREGNPRNRKEFQRQLGSEANPEGEGAIPASPPSEGADPPPDPAVKRGQLLDYNA